MASRSHRWYRRHAAQVKLYPTGQRHLTGRGHTKTLLKEVKDQVLLGLWTWYSLLSDVRVASLLRRFLRPPHCCPSPTPAGDATRHASRLLRGASQVFRRCGRGARAEWFLRGEVRSWTLVAPWADDWAWTVSGGFGAVRAWERQGFFEWKTWE